jgi:hypothetical protein
MVIFELTFTTKFPRSLNDKSRGKCRQFQVTKINCSSHALHYSYGFEVLNLIPWLSKKITAAVWELKGKDLCTLLQLREKRQQSSTASIRTTYSFTSCTLSTLGPREPRTLDFPPWSVFETAAEKRFSSSDMSISGALCEEVTKEKAYET